MKTKRAYCSSCSNGSNHPIWEAAIRRDADANQVPVWECRCCHQTMPRRVVGKKRPATKDYTVDVMLAAMRAELGG